MSDATTGAQIGTDLIELEQLREGIISPDNVVIGIKQGHQNGDRCRQCQVSRE
jgi:hypothetical protein